jgi:hypothetical protein
MYTDPDGEIFLPIINAVKDLFVNVGNSIGNLINGRPDKWDWTSTCNAWKIDVGLFKGDWKQILSRFTWEWHQTLLGYGASQGYNLIGGVKSVSHYGGATVVETYKERWGAFTLSSFIMGESGIKANLSNQLFMHEYGHYLQSQSWGPLYLPKFGIPSLMSAAGDGVHRLYPVEQDANARAYDYFKNKPGFTTWDYVNYPMYLGRIHFGWNDVLTIGLSVGRALLTGNPFALFDMPFYYHTYYQSLMKNP